MVSFSSEVYTKLVSALTSHSAAQEILNALKGESTITSRMGDSTAEVGLRFGASETEGHEVRVIDETVTLTNAASADLTATVPAGAVIRSVQANLETAVTGDGSGDDGLVKVGVGTAADPDKYGKTTGLTKNLKIDTIPSYSVLGAVETIKIYAVDTNGAAVTEKFTAGATVRVRIVFDALNSLDDA